MMDFFKEGGWGMFPVLLFGVLTLVAAGTFAFRADARSRGFIDAMSRSIVFFTFTGVLSNLNAIGRYLEHEHVPPERYSEVIVMGLREAIGPGVMGSAFLALIYLFVAIGQRRVDARAEAK